MAHRQVAPLPDTKVSMTFEREEQSKKFLDSDPVHELSHESSTTSCSRLPAGIGPDVMTPGRCVSGNGNAVGIGVKRDAGIDRSTWKDSWHKDHLDKIFSQVQASLTNAVATELSALRKQVSLSMDGLHAQTPPISTGQLSNVHAGVRYDQTSCRFAAFSRSMRPSSDVQSFPSSKLSSCTLRAAGSEITVASADMDERTADADGLVQRPRVAKFKCPGEDQHVTPLRSTEPDRCWENLISINSEDSDTLCSVQDNTNDMTIVLMQLNSGNKEFLVQSCFSLWASMRKPLNFNLHPSWDECEGAPRKVVNQLAQVQCSTDGRKHHRSVRRASIRALEEGQYSCQRFIVCPSGMNRVLWDFMSTLLLVYDMITIPLQAFNMSSNGAWLFMDRFTLVFWTCDMVASCLTGYVDKGVTIMEPKRIWKKYIRSWLSLDLIIVVPDWIFTVASSEDHHTTERFLRILRIVRLARLIRLAKLSRAVSRIRDRIDSEHMFILANIAKLIIMLLMVNHGLACLWYMIGDFGAKHSLENWIGKGSKQDFHPLSVEYRYFTALHWSLTQFTPASMSVQPQNVYERSFAIAVLVFGLVLFSSFVSNITASMTQLRTMRDDKSKQFWLLRRYLRQNRVQTQLVFRVLRFVEYACNEREDLVTESRIHVLNLLSDQLREELRYEVAFSRILTHPLLERLSRVSRETMHGLTKSALQQRALASEDTLFHVGIPASHMHIIDSGELVYGKAEDENQITVTEDDWFCEPALWTAWVHLGDAKALVESRIISLDAAVFAEVVSCDALAWESATVYAEAFVRMLCMTPRCDLTDVAHSRPLLMQFLPDEAEPSWTRRSK